MTAEIENINKILAEKYGGRVHAELKESNRSIVVSGELDEWQDVLDACNLCVHKEDGWHVVNHINFTGAEIPPMHMPDIEDDSLEGDRPDVLIIGGGVVGTAIAREISRWKLDILLVEKEADVAVQASSRNDGQIHPGVDQKKPNIKLSYELRGNRMYTQVCEELGVPFRRVGQYVAFREWYLKPIFKIVARKKRKLGITDTEIVGRKELYEAVPSLNPGFHLGLVNKGNGIICPYGLTIAFAENAIQNGARISLNTAVTGMEVVQGEDGMNRITAVRTNRGTIYPRLIVNAAGVWSDKIAAMGGDEFFSIHPRCGTEVILDHKVADRISNTVFSYRDLVMKGEKNTKGGGILRTVDDNILIGPDAVETYERENYATHPESIDWLFNKQKKSTERIDKRDIITYFTGVRASDFEEDFIVEKGRETENLLHCAAIQSPGLTSAPALAEDTALSAVEMLGGESVVARNEDFDPVRKPIPRLKDLGEEERAALIAENPDYGIIVCRCEEISKGEILDALRSPLCVPTLDGVKRRVRPGMGRCQGGFCGPVVTQIIADFLETELKDVTKSGNGSVISYGSTKEAQDE